MNENEMNNLNRVVGRIEGKLDTMMHEQKSQWDEINKISSSLNKHKIKTATIFGILLASWEVLKHFFKLKGGHS